MSDSNLVRTHVHLRAEDLKWIDRHVGALRLRNAIVRQGVAREVQRLRAAQQGGKLGIELETLAAGGSE